MDRKSRTRLGRGYLGKLFPEDIEAAVVRSRQARLKLARTRADVLPAGSPLCIALNRGQRWRQECIEPRSHNRVALAGGLFETGAIDDLNLSPTIADETGRLQRLRGQCHRFAISPQHVRQELVRIWQRFAFRPIVHHEEPSAHALFR